MHLMQQQTNAYADRFIREPERRNLTGLSRTTWWRLELRGEAPARRKLSQNAVGWSLKEILEWQDQRRQTDAI